MTEIPVLVLRAVTGESFETARDEARARFNAFDAALQEHRKSLEPRVWRTDFTDPNVDHYWEIP